MFRLSHSGTGPLQTIEHPARGHRWLTRTTLFIGLLSIVGSSLTGYFAYAHSQKVIRGFARANNLDMARIIKTHVETARDQVPLDTMLADLNNFWAQAGQKHNASFLCVIGAGGRLLLNTKRPEKVGTDVGDVEIPAQAELGVGTVKELLASGSDWVGCNRNHEGEEQVAAYAYAPGHRLLVAVHVPETVIDQEVMAASLPWALGWGFIALILMPSSLALLLRAFTASQRDREVALKRLRLAEQEVRHSRDFLSIALSEFPLLIWRSGTDAECNYVNQTWLDFTGRMMDEELGNGWLESVHPDDRPARIEQYQKAFNAREPFSMEYRLRRRDGTYRWVADWGRPLLTRSGDFEGYIGGCQDITPRRETETALQRQRIERELTTERLHTLSRRLMEIQETERHHLARELHDEIGQLLTVTRINLQALSETPEPESLAPRLKESIEVVDRLLEQIRHLSLDLRPPLLDDLGLKAALKWYVNQQAARSGLQIRFVTMLGEKRFDPSIETACFRVIQEAVTNVIRHAHASHAVVEVIQDGNALRLTIIDDGDGFDTAAVRANAAQGASFGLISIEERLALVGGRLILSSTPGQGTQIIALVGIRSSSALEAPEPTMSRPAGKA